MRVIAGLAKGRRLKCLNGLAIRPTSDRVKETLFNILAPVMVEARFLDLFAGTGNVGIEALSRGAANAVFVEEDPRAVALVYENLRHTGLLTLARVWRLSCGLAIDRARRQGEVFDVAFLDPPYEQGLVRWTMLALGKAGIMSQGGLVIAEHSRREAVPEQADGLGLYRQEAFGDIRLSFYRLGKLEG
ncbi:MAG: 16S rRNA (guanine(966)-N(2))-methyltransferase RsmD [Bacillota bacterium]